MFILWGHTQIHTSSLFGPTLPTCWSLNLFPGVKCTPSSKHLEQHVCVHHHLNLFIVNDRDWIQTHRNTEVPLSFTHWILKPIKPVHCVRTRQDWQADNEWAPDKHPGKQTDKHPCYVAPRLADRQAPMQSPRQTPRLCSTQACRQTSTHGSR